MLATVLLSQGVPMILAGDEIGHSQDGNNNAYCQDNETSWLDWQAARAEMTEAVQALADFRVRTRLARTAFARGPDAAAADTPVAVWLHPRGGPMQDGDWDDGDGDQGALRCLGLWLSQPGHEDVLIVVNAGDDARFALPEGGWVLRIDTARDGVACNDPVSGMLDLPWQAVMALTRADERPPKA